MHSSEQAGGARGRWSRIATGIGGAVHQAVRPARLLIAVKTALAVAAAWLIAPLMPGITDDYPYYAPLGALISMYPTLMTSLRSSLQTLLGLGVGVGIAALVVLTAGPSVWTLAAATALGVLVSGTGWFGAGKEYIPVAALFVLIVGGADAEDYSLGYVLQTVVGVAVGLIVNVLIPPAPLVAEARARIDEFSRTLSSHLHAIGDAVAVSWPPEDRTWVRDATALAATARALREALSDADESRRGNPRARGHHADTQGEHDRLETLDDVAHQIRDISGCLGDTIWSRPGALPLEPDLVSPLASACHAVAEVLVADDDESDERRADAQAQVDRLLRVVHDSSLGTRTVTGPGVLTAMHLNRILILLSPATADGSAQSRT
ncbi:aromatic acid exporter family protein [Microbacterium sp. KUDC0406]|uniref:FUSC family protein n=1 Tax=Microbacterium sp. KUDC0406 TaxID=2909588 RepID=UPI001F2225A9|nr:FUSC family protein [Microbacterium sp. KUDC0406]UJP09039.1 aromatic acid exporter family protein [Microbacterium sp. KUDC0406]